MGLLNRILGKPRRSSAHRSIHKHYSAERLELRLSLDGALSESSAPPEVGGHYAANELPGEAIRFFLSERGIGEGPVVENPTIEMALGETKTLYIWMQLPEHTGLYGAGINVVSATSGVLQVAARSIYERSPGDRWQFIIESRHNGPSFTSGDMLGQPAAGTFDGSRLSTPFYRSSDPSYDPATGAMLFASISVTAAQVGETDLVLEVGTMTVAAWQPDNTIAPNVPVYLGVGDEPVSGIKGPVTGSLADAHLVVKGPPSAAKAVGDTYEFSVHSGAVVVVPAASGILSNDVIPEGATIEVASPPRTGRLELGANGGFRYTAPSISELRSHWRGKKFVNESFVYRIHSPDGTVALARVGLVLHAGLTAVDDYLSMNVRDESVKRLSDVVAGNDLWFTQDFHPTQIEIVTPPENGSVIFRTDSFGEYNPNLGFRGRDRFTYRLTDGVNEAIGTVYIDVTFENQAPQAADDEVEIDNNPYATISPSILSNDTDPDGDYLDWRNVRIIDPPQHGTAWKSPGSIHYHPVEGFSGTDTLTYVVDDGIETSNVATVTIHVTLPPEEPSVGDSEQPLLDEVDEEEESPLPLDFYVTTADVVLFENGNVRIPMAQLVANDRDIHGNELVEWSLQIVNWPRHGSLPSDGDELIYMPNDTFVNWDTFTYVLSGPGNANSAPTTVTINRQYRLPPGEPQLPANPIPIFGDGPICEVIVPAPRIDGEFRTFPIVHQPIVVALLEDIPAAHGAVLPDVVLVDGALRNGCGFEYLGSDLNLAIPQAVNRRVNAVQRAVIDEIVTYASFDETSTSLIARTVRRANRRLGRS
jgi:hypothetical protein